MNQAHVRGPASNLQCMDFEAMVGFLDTNSSSASKGDGKRYNESYGMLCRYNRYEAPLKEGAAL